MKRFENTPLVKPTGFREYDARWLFPEEINLSGMQALGFGLGNVLFELLGDANSRALSVMITAPIRKASSWR
jgi:hypothetical protein